jgi:hypothetical protein
MSASTCTRTVQAGARHIPRRVARSLIFSGCAGQVSPGARVYDGKWLIWIGRGDDVSTGRIVNYRRLQVANPNIDGARLFVALSIQGRVYHF